MIPPLVLHVEEGHFQRAGVRHDVLQVMEGPPGGFGEIGGEQRVAEEIAAEHVALLLPALSFEDGDRDEQDRLLRQLQQAMDHAPQEDLLREGLSMRSEPR